MLIFNEVKLVSVRGHKLNFLLKLNFYIDTYELIYLLITKPFFTDVFSLIYIYIVKN